jgi:hypothetical protein
MKNPRRSPEQTRAAQKQREELQRIKDEEMSRKMQEAYKRAQGQSVSGMKKGGMTGRDGCAIRGRTRA